MVYIVVVRAVMGKYCAHVQAESWILEAVVEEGEEGPYQGAGVVEIQKHKTYQEKSLC